MTPREIRDRLNDIARDLTNSSLNPSEDAALRSATYKLGMLRGRLDSAMEKDVPEVATKDVVIRPAEPPPELSPQVRILDALENAWPRGLKVAVMVQLFAGHLTEDEVWTHVEALAAAGRITNRTETGGMLPTTFRIVKDRPDGQSPAEKISAGSISGSPAT